MDNSTTVDVMPYRVELRKFETWISAGVWCVEYIGEQGVAWAWNWHRRGCRIAFKEEKDAILFALRWA